MTRLEGTSRLPPPNTVLYSKAVPSGLNTDKPQSNGYVAAVIAVLIAPAVVGYVPMDDTSLLHRAVPPKARPSSSYAAVNPQLGCVAPM